MNSHFDASHSNRGVLITGGCGFLGSNLADRLAERGETVFLLDNLGRAGVEKNAEWLRLRHEHRVGLEIADIRDLRAVNRLVARATAVLHLAAQVAVTTSLTHPADDLDINVRGTLNVLESVRLNNPDVPVILASTNKVYGPLFEAGQVVVRGDRYVPVDERRELGIDERAPLDPYSPYGCSKASADQYMHDYARVFGLRTVVLRMSCIYGPRQFGNEDQGWIAHFLKQAMRGLPITIYGDGYQVRDALFVRDAVDAWLRARDRIRSGEWQGVQSRRWTEERGQPARDDGHDGRIGLQPAI